MILNMMVYIFLYKVNLVMVNIMDKVKFSILKMIFKSSIKDNLKKIMQMDRDK